MKEKKSKFYSGTGRRKTATARVWLYEKRQAGFTGIVVNERPIREYFGDVPLAEVACLRPFEVLDVLGKFAASVKVEGGGRQAQLGAVVHGLARALLAFNPEFKSRLRKEGLLTRDSRMKERKKYGRRRARRGQQWAKR